MKTAAGGPVIITPATERLAMRGEAVITQSLLDRLLVLACWDWGRDRESELVGELLTLGADPNWTALPGWLLHGRCGLHFAAAHGHKNIMEQLLEANACLESRDDDYSTPLHLAAGNGQISAVRVLIEAGAGLHHEDCMGRLPMHSAMRALERNAHDLARVRREVVDEARRFRACGSDEAKKQRYREEQIETPGSVLEFEELAHALETEIWDRRAGVILQKLVEHQLIREKLVRDQKENKRNKVPVKRKGLSLPSSNSFRSQSTSPTLTPLNAASLGATSVTTTIELTVTKRSSEISTTAAGKEDDEDKSQDENQGEKGQQQQQEEEEEEDGDAGDDSTVTVQINTAASPATTSVTTIELTETKRSSEISTTAAGKEDDEDEEDTSQDENQDEKGQQQQQEEEEEEEGDAGDDSTVPVQINTGGETKANTKKEASQGRVQSSSADAGGAGERSRRPGKSLRSQSSNAAPALPYGRKGILHQATAPAASGRHTETATGLWSSQWHSIEASTFHMHSTQNTTLLQEWRELLLLRHKDFLVEVRSKRLHRQRRVYHEVVRILMEALASAGSNHDPTQNVIACLKHLDHDGQPAFTRDARMTWFTENQARMEALTFDPLEKGFSSDTFQDARTMLAVNLVWRKRVRCQFRTSLCLFAVYLLLLFAATVSLGSRMQRSVPAIEEAIRERFAPEATATEDGYRDIDTPEAWWSWLEERVLPAFQDDEDTADAGAEHRLTPNDIFNTLETESQSNGDHPTSPAQQHGRAHKAVNGVSWVVGSARLRSVRSLATPCAEGAINPDALEKRYPGDGLCLPWSGSGVGYRRHMQQQPEALVWANTTFHFTAFGLDRGPISRLWSVDSLGGMVGRVPHAGYYTAIPPVSSPTSNKTQRLSASALQAAGFVNLNTRAVVVEFILFNREVNIISSVKLATEFTTSGLVVPSVRIRSCKLANLYSEEDLWVLVLQVVVYMCFAVRVSAWLRSVCILPEIFEKIRFKVRQHQNRMKEQRAMVQTAKDHRFSFRQQRDGRRFSSGSGPGNMVQRHQSSTGSLRSTGSSRAIDLGHQLRTLDAERDKRRFQKDSAALEATLHRKFPVEEEHAVRHRAATTGNPPHRETKTDGQQASRSQNLNDEHSQNLNDEHEDEVQACCVCCNFERVNRFSKGQGCRVAVPRIIIMHNGDEGATHDDTYWDHESLPSRAYSHLHRPHKRLLRYPKWYVCTGGMQRRCFRCMLQCCRFSNRACCCCCPGTCVKHRAEFFDNLKNEMEKDKHVPVIITERFLFTCGRCSDSGFVKAYGSTICQYKLWEIMLLAFYLVVVGLHVFEGIWHVQGGRGFDLSAYTEFNEELDSDIYLMQNRVVGFGWLTFFSLFEFMQWSSKLYRTSGVLFMIIEEMIARLARFFLFMVTVVMAFGILRYAIFGMEFGVNTFVDFILSPMLELNGDALVGAEYLPQHAENLANAIDIIYIFLMVLLMANLLIAFMADAFSDVRVCLSFLSHFVGVGCYRVFWCVWIAYSTSHPAESRLALSLSLAFSFSLSLSLSLLWFWFCY